MKDAQHVLQYQLRMMRVLLRWAVVSIASGLALLAPGPALRGFGGMMLAWGVINALVAVGASRAVRSRQAAPRPMRDEARAAARILWINCGLDVLYVCAGAGMVLWTVVPMTRGAGAGVFVQGVWLLGFDLIHAVRLARVGR